MERRDFLEAALSSAGIAGLAIATASGAPAQAQPGPVRSRLDEVLARGKVIVGVTSEAPPFGFIDDKGELIGSSSQRLQLFLRRYQGEYLTT
jgi:ABC-type amino acid transport substrate-binding protein